MTVVNVPDEINPFKGEYVDVPGPSSDSFVVVVIVVYWPSVMGVCMNI